MEAGDLETGAASAGRWQTAATRRPSTLEQYASYSSAQLSDTEATSVSAYDSDASVDDEDESYAIEDVMARGTGRQFAGASGGAHKSHRGDFGPSETDDSSDYGQNMLASETTGTADDEMKRAHRRRFQWGPARCCVSYKIGALTVVADYHDALGQSTKLMVGPCESPPPPPGARTARALPSSRATPNRAPKPAGVLAPLQHLTPRVTLSRARAQTGRAWS